jgi:16S rRNA (guanine(966)-N(2))-methyltransferase RsmD
VRITTGKYRGFVLQSPKNDSIRPTSDKVKQALFNILVNRSALDGADVLDLFCGSGALGCEALSRGAKSVVFIDNGMDSIQLVRANLSKLKLDQQVLKMDYLSALKIFRQNSTKFDLIFLDPPYNKDMERKALNFILDNDLLNHGGMISCETDANVSLKNLSEKYFVKMDEYSFGNTKLIILEKVL